MIPLLEIYVDSTTYGWGVYASQIDEAWAGVYDHKKTVNQGEFEAMKFALIAAKRLIKTAFRTNIYSDSQLVVRVIHGENKVKSESIKQLASECCEMYMALIPHGISIKKIKREYNTIADNLSKGKGL